MINEEYKIWKKNTPFLYGVPPTTQQCIGIHSSLEDALHSFLGQEGLNDWLCRSGYHARPGVAQLDSSMATGVDLLRVLRHQLHLSTLSS